MGKPAVLAIEIISDTRRAADGIDRTNKKLDAFAVATKAAGAAAAAYMAVKPLVEFGKEAWQLAADAESAMTAVDTVFKGNAQQIKDWSDDAAAAFGIARGEAAQMSAVVGAQLQGLGFSLDEAADLTIDLNERAADLAATFGGPTSDAIQAIGALLRGERDPIERYGVSIKQADINARLAAEGLTGLEGEARKQAEAQAALALLFEATASSENAVAENADNINVKSQKLRAQLTNLKETIGTELITTFNELTGELGSTGTSLKGVEDFVRQLGQAVRSLLVPVFRNFLKPAIDDVRAGFEALERAGIDMEDVMMGLKPILGLLLAPLYAVAAAARAIAWAFEKVASAIAWAKSKVDSFRAPSWLPGVNAASAQTVAVTPAMTGPQPGIMSMSAPGLRAIPRTTTNRAAAAPNITIQAGVGDPRAIAREIRRLLVDDNAAVGWRHSSGAGLVT